MRTNKSGVLSQTTLREFDISCLPPVAPLNPEQIREAFHTSQAVFATYLNTSVSTVQKWETGNKHPTGAVLKLLHLVQKKSWGLWCNENELQINDMRRNAHRPCCALRAPHLKVAYVNK